LKGKTIDVAVYEEVDVPTSSLVEKEDVEPATLSDDKVSVTMAEEGNAIELTRLHRDIASYTNVDEATRKIIGHNKSHRIDNIIRAAACFDSGSVAYDIFGGTATARSSLTSASHPVTFAKLMEMSMLAENLGIPPLDDGTYFSVINSMMLTEISAMDQWLKPAQYIDSGVIASGKISNDPSKNRLPGEQGMMANIRFVVSPRGKLFLSAGGGGQATTLAADAAAGATTITVASATGIAVGNYLTIGTVESAETEYPTTEQVKVTSIAASPVISVQGIGNTKSNQGLKYAHSSGAAVTEADNVAAVPILGQHSIVGAYPESVGRDGEVHVHEAPSRIQGRFWDYDWYAVLGLSPVPGNIVRGQFGTAGHIFGPN
jgi:N4-gp56 family major capsid protein